MLYFHELSTTIYSPSKNAGGSRTRPYGTIVSALQVGRQGQSPCPTGALQIGGGLMAGRPTGSYPIRAKRPGRRDAPSRWETRFILP
jgi:hypothetical protein